MRWSAQSIWRGDFILSSVDGHLDPFVSQQQVQQRLESNKTLMTISRKLSMFQEKLLLFPIWHDPASPPPKHLFNTPHLDITCSPGEHKKVFKYFIVLLFGTSLSVKCMVRSSYLVSLFFLVDWRNALGRCQD